MFGCVDRGLRQGKLVERRHVPSEEDGIEDDKRGDRGQDGPGHRTDRTPPEQWTDHPGRGTGDQQRRDDHRDDEVLHHVGGEEVPLTDRVQWGAERQAGNKDAKVEPDHVAGRGNSAHLWSPHAWSCPVGNRTAKADKGGAIAGQRERVCQHEETQSQEDLRFSGPLVPDVA